MGSKASKRSIDFQFSDGCLNNFPTEDLKNWLYTLNKSSKPLPRALPSHKEPCQLYNLSIMLQRDFQTILCHSIRNMLQSMLKCDTDHRSPVEMALATNDALNIYICILELILFRFSDSSMRVNLFSLRRYEPFITRVKEEFNVLWESVDKVLMSDIFGRNAERQTNNTDESFSLFAPLQDWVQGLCRCLRLVGTTLFDNDQQKSEKAYLTLLKCLSQLISLAREQLSVLSKIIDVLPSPSFTTVADSATVSDETLKGSSDQSDTDGHLLEQKGILRHSRNSKSVQKVKFCDYEIGKQESLIVQTNAEPKSCLRPAKVLHAGEVIKQSGVVVKVDQGGDRLISRDQEPTESQKSKEPILVVRQMSSSYMKFERTNPCATEQIINFSVCCQN